MEIFWFQLEDIYKNAHAAIRADPAHKPVAKDRSKMVQKRYNAVKKTYNQRKLDVKKKKVAFLAKLAEENEA